MGNKPTGRDEVVQALLEAAVDLFSEDGISGVSIRQIADKAGVNHGLVHRHFGSKEDLARAVGDMIDGKMRGNGTARLASFAEAIDFATTAAQRDPRIGRCLARLLLDGERGVMPEGPGNYLRALVELAAGDQARGALSGSIDPRELVFMFAALGLGMELFGDYLSSAIGIPGTDIAEMENRYKDLLIGAFKGTSPGGSSPNKSP